MKKLFSTAKRIIALLIVFGMVTGMVPVTALEGIGATVASAAETDSAYELNNGYLQVTLSDKTGGFGIRTVEGDKVNKSDNDQYLVFEYDEDNTSFTSFQVTRGGTTKEYIFGGSYPGSSDLTVTQNTNELIATWSVDDLTFRQILSLANTGSNEHGTVQISYEVSNSGAAADVKVRILMDTALGFQDYAFYRIGKTYLEQETALDTDGYEKSFYAVDNTGSPRITAYTINASIDDRECRPYKTIFAHWNNLASTVFDYTVDPGMTFTNFNNPKYLTSDSAYAQYFDLGQIAQGDSAMAATNYGVYSNESVEAEDTMTVNINAPDVVNYAVNEDGTEDRTAYENDGIFSVRTHIKNISDHTYSRIRIVVTTAGSIGALDQMGESVNSSYDNPYSMEITDVEAGEQLDINWSFLATPLECGQYSRIIYKVYDVSDETTQGTGQLMMENLLGEGSSYIMCPGSVTSIPVLKFTAISPETIYAAGVRTLNILGENFSMLLDKSAYAIHLSRVDGMRIDGQSSFTIPADQFQVDDSTNVITVILNEELPGTLPVGRYQMTIDFADPTKQDVTGPALQFDVSEDEVFRNDAYGFLAVVKTSDFEYQVHTFDNEETYWDELDAGTLEREDILLEFRGIFMEEEKADGSVTYTGISNNRSHNVMTLNGALDIYDGTCVITEDDGSVTVDFDADIYTTGSGTYVHTGVAALTELERGEDYALVPYSEDGDREDMNAETIALLWPSVGQAFQTLMGLLFNLKYGELGVIAHEDAPSAKGSETRVVAFGAAFDLSFLIPASTDSQIILDSAGKTKDILGSSYDAAEHNAVSFSPAEIRALNQRAAYNSNTVNTSASQDDVDNGRFADISVDDTPGYNAFSVVIDDILFGGEYLGVNMELAMGIPPYIMNMPALEAVLSIRTVGDWAFGVEGQCHFTSFSMEASIDILSYEGIPIVDSLHFFIGGITPGFNIDGVGVLWLQGGGGGIENIYDTIFLTDTIPPLRLIIQAQFSVMQIFSAIATMGLSLQGVSLDLENGQFSEYADESSGIVTVPQPVTMTAGMQIDWYPEFYFHAYVNMVLAMAIRGSGYIVADATGFYEFFLRAAVSVPSDIPIIGGYEVGAMNLGVSTEKVWGKVTWMDAISLALTYYWGGEIDWNNGAGVYPTYPELIGMEEEDAMVSMALEYDEVTGKTLMMDIGSNVTVSAASGMDAPTVKAPGLDILTSDVVNGSMHTMRLVSNGSGKILSIQWPCADEAQARLEAESIVIADQVNSANQIPIKIWSKDDAEGANANFSYNPATETAYLSLVFGADHETVYTTQWNVTTPAAAVLVAYDVAPLPEVEVTAAEITGSLVALTLEETIPGSFTSVTVVAEGTDGQTLLLGGSTNLFSEGQAVLTLNMPASARSDTYSLRIVCKDDIETNYHEANAEITYVNPNQPAAPTAVAAENAGDYKLNVTATVSGEYDGLQFTALDDEGNVVNGMSSVLLNKDGSVVSYDENGYMVVPESTTAAASYLIGGHYEQTVEDEDGQQVQMITGLSAGNYTIRVRSFKRVGDGAAVLLSAPTDVSVTVRQPVKTEIAIVGYDANSRAGIAVSESQNGEAYTRTVFTTGDVLLQLSAAESFSGRWTLDGGYQEGYSGTIAAGTTATVRLSGLNDGNHTFSFVGKNGYGDSTSATYILTVDTLGPRLMLAEPVNGSLFDYRTGSLVISGVTDNNTTMAVVDNTTNRTVFNDALTVGEEGLFSQAITLDPTVLSHDLTIVLSDPYGNTCSKDVSVMSNAMGSIESIKLVSRNTDVTNTKMTAGTVHALVLVAELKDSDLEVVINKPGMVDWVLDVAEGEASFTESGDGILLTTASDAEGMVTARFLVSSEGSYPVSAAFGYTGEQIRDLSNGIHVQMYVPDQYYTGNAVTPGVTVWYDGAELTEGVDYTITGYSNNIQVTTEENPAQVTITGMGLYTGTATGDFQISYLVLEDGMVTVTGVSGNNGYFVSDVTLAAAQGYELVLESGVPAVEVTVEGESSVTFRVRRLSDGAMTDLVVRTVSIDKTAPTGTITLDETVWSRILGFVTFGGYKVNTLVAEVTAEDNIAVATVDYVISNVAYETVTDLLNASPDWVTYSNSNKPTIRENENQIIYVRIVDVAGHETYLSSEEVFVDTLAPQVSVSVTGTTESSLSFNVITSEAGKFYYTVRKATEAAPTVAEMLALTTVVTVTDEQAGQNVAVTVTGLEGGTTYIVYVVAEDTVVMLGDGSAAPNVSDVVASDPASTAEVATSVEGLFRLKGKNRYQTGLAIANELKEVLGVEKFGTVVVAYGEKFPDALTGSYLAAMHDAPILLTDKSVDTDVLNYIRQNLVEGGKVYILGGTAAVSQTFEDSAKGFGFDVERLKGKNRYETNLAILAEAGVDSDTEILIATGSNYADSLSASATGLPMLLVDKELTEAQINFLKDTSKKFAILGGTAAVSADIEAALDQIGDVERVKGKSRYETSVVIAERYFENPDAIVLAYGEAFPDGLCGGPLAIQVGAPLILTHNDKLAAADAYVQNVNYGYVTGGTGRLTDETVREIFDVDITTDIVVKE